MALPGPPAPPGPPDAPRLLPPAAPFPAMAMEESEKAIAVSEQDFSEESAEEETEAQGSSGFFQGAPLSEKTQASVLLQNRIIVRTVDMGIVVADVPQTADEVLARVQRRGGWLVDSDRSRTHHAFLSVRVPAESLDEFVDFVRDMADRVQFETSTSQDVTDEYVDNEARLNGLRRTEERLFDFLDRAADIEDALSVQRELAVIQLEMEAIQGRLRFLSQTAAYSLVHLTLTTRPGDMAVEIGPDAATYRAGLPGTFRATFEAPEGVKEFRFIWDFGDGTPPVEGTRTAPTTNPGERVTSTISHSFEDVEQSPFIVQLEISGIGDTGVFEGSDSLIATVTEIPDIDVFAGQDRVVDEGDEVEYIGSFTRPEALSDFEYRWDFGDGSATVFGVPGDGETRAMASHEYQDYRPDPYQVVLTVTARSEAGEVKGTGSFYVYVNEVEGFVVAGWDLDGTAKSAVRALTAVGQALLIILIWAGILSPVWLAALAVLFLLRRVRRRSGGGAGSLVPWRRAGSGVGGENSRPFQGTDSAGSSAATADTSGSPGPARDGEAGQAICVHCGRPLPAADAAGNWPRYCPYCGEET